MAKLTSRYKYALYLDSKDINSIQILEKWFKYGFFDKQQAVVIFRYYPKTIFTFPKELTERDFNFIGYNKFFSICLGKLPAVFYPFNTNTNPLLIKQRQTKHIFIGHGESDKEASINPMIRMYDLVFSSGQSSTNRYIDNHIINQEDRTTRAFEIGMPYLGDAFRNVSENPIKRDAILYCPTWEGANKNQQYSSLENETSLTIIAELIKSGKKVFFMPHPSTGVKDKKYIKTIEKILRGFGNERSFIFAINSKNQKMIAKKINVKNTIAAETLDWRNIATCVCDISSMVSISDYHSCNTVLLDKKKPNTENLTSTIEHIIDISTISLGTVTKLKKSLLTPHKEQHAAQAITPPHLNINSNEEFFTYLYESLITKA